MVNPQVSAAQKKTITRSPRSKRDPSVQVLPISRQSGDPCGGEEKVPRGRMFVTFWEWPSFYQWQSAENGHSIDFDGRWTSRHKKRSQGKWEYCILLVRTICWARSAFFNRPIVTGVPTRYKQYKRYTSVYAVLSRVWVAWRCVVIRGPTHLKKNP